MPTDQSDMDSPSLGHSSQVIQDSVNLPPHKYRGVLEGRDSQFIRCCIRWSSDLQIIGSSDTDQACPYLWGCNYEMKKWLKTKPVWRRQNQTQNTCGSPQLCIYSEGHLLNKAPPDNLLRRSHHLLSFSCNSAQCSSPPQKLGGRIRECQSIVPFLASLLKCWRINA